MINVRSIRETDFDLRGKAIRLYGRIVDPIRHSIIPSAEAVSYHERKAQEHLQRSRRNSRYLNPVFGKHTEIRELYGEEVTSQPLGASSLIPLAYNKAWELYHLKKIEEM